MPKIILDSLCKKFGKNIATDNLSLNINDGEYVCMLGPTGSGKTTCMRMICGLTKPDSGKIYLDGKDMTNEGIDIRDSTMLSQTYSLFPHMSVYDNVIFSPHIKKWPEDISKKITMDMLRMVHLESKSEWKPKNLSGGQQQRTALARALASGSKILLLDEPLRALDARLRIDLRRELRTIVKNMGLTCIHVTHDKDEAMEIADKIAIVYHGKVVQFDTPINVFNNPMTLFVANFIDRSNMISGKIGPLIDGHMSVVTESGISFLAKDIDISSGIDVILSVKMVLTRLYSINCGHSGYCRGIIKSILYEGATIMVDVLVKDLGIISSRPPSWKYNEYNIGDTVIIDWSPDDASVFKKSEYESDMNRG